MIEVLTENWRFRQAAYRVPPTWGRPRCKSPYSELACQPIREQLTYLRANGLNTLIVTESGVDFMRRMTENVYGIPIQNSARTGGGLHHQDKIRG
jgi:hypothetical protein